MKNQYDPTDVKPAYEIPTYDSSTAQWGYTSFYTFDEFRTFVKSVFKEPGKYKFDKTAFLFNEQARLFSANKVYCTAPFRSKDYISYWESQKQRCRKGAIFIGADGTRWYLTRDYYMWLNFLPIMNKEKQEVLGSDDTESFVDVRDAQYHMALYELLAELHYEHAAVLKKRQIASSLYHAAKLINQIWFEKGSTCKMAASDWDFIGEEGTWKMLNQYRSFLNEHTGWYRPFKPEGVGMWTQGIEVTVNGRKSTRGLLSNLLGITLDKSPTKGVGGAVKYFFYEEGGIAPTANKTYEYVRPALQSGLVTVGMFIIAGSVGDLKQCQPLKDFLLNPRANGFYGVETNLFNSKGEIRLCALFIPEQWSMLPYIDEFGNSLVEEALAAILTERGLWKKEGLAADQYQLRVSQKPINIEEAFAYREESPFPQHLVSKQLQRIEDGVYPEEYITLYRDETGKVVSKQSNQLPIQEFPLPKGRTDKEGVIVVYERPDILASWGTYYASIDPVSEGKTTTSDSLCSIFIYKNAIEVTKQLEDGTFEHYVEGDKLVAEWCGRFDDINKTHERLEMMIEWYNAWTLVEANVGLFFTYMTLKRKTHYLVPSNQMIFNKEVSNSYAPSHPFGWKNTGSIFKTHLLSAGIEFLSEKISSDFLENGDEVNIKYGIERLQGSRMLCKEMQAYYPGLNVDRLVAYCALVAFVRIQRAIRVISRKIEITHSKVSPKDLYQIPHRPFKSLIGGSLMKPIGRPSFKHFR
ncbi:MAG TPA: hypothetical protein VGM30_10640 [Puia sp.]|jgi:hypothetical protein